MDIKTSLYVKTLTIIQQLMKEALMLDADHTDPFGREVLACFDAWGGTDAMVRVWSDEEGDLKQEIIEFLKVYNVKPTYKVETVTISFSAPIGSATITIAATATVSDQDSANAATLALWDSLQAQYNVLASRRGADGVKPKIDAVVQQASASDEGIYTPNADEKLETIAATSISCEVKENKRYFKVHGGQFSQYGVRIWNEVLEEAGLLDLISTETQKINGKAVILMKQKPDKSGWKAIKVLKLTVVR